MDISVSQKGENIGAHQLTLFALVYFLAGVSRDDVYAHVHLDCRAAWLYTSSTGTDDMSVVRVPLYFRVLSSQHRRAHAAAIADDGPHAFAILVVAAAAAVVAAAAVAAGLHDVCP
uniref:Uncharacterized protein n=1 Tax=Glossina pallidipes TaxID=7398 RepID=A0A1B0AHQ8_GLOPL